MTSAPVLDHRPDPLPSNDRNPIVNTLRTHAVRILRRNPVTASYLIILVPLAIVVAALGGGAYLAAFGLGVAGGLAIVGVILLAERLATVIAGETPLVRNARKLGEVLDRADAERAARNARADELHRANLTAARDLRDELQNLRNL